MEDDGLGVFLAVGFLELGFTVLEFGVDGFLRNNDVLCNAYT